MNCSEAIVNITQRQVSQRNKDVLRRFSFTIVENFLSPLYFTNICLAVTGRFRPIAAIDAYSARIAATG
jgi:hypothetical protein